MVFQWINERTGARHALLCFVTHVEAGSTPKGKALYSILEITIDLPMYHIGAQAIVRRVPDAFVNHHLIEAAP